MRVFFCKRADRAGNDSQAGTHDDMINQYERPLELSVGDQVSSCPSIRDINK